MDLHLYILSFETIAETILLLLRKEHGTYLQEIHAGKYFNIFSNWIFNSSSRPLRHSTFTRNIFTFINSWCAVQKIYSISLFLFSTSTPEYSSLFSVKINVDPSS